MNIDPLDYLYTDPSFERRVVQKERPSAKERKREYQREYWREYQQRPEVKERKRMYMRDYNQRPDVKKRRRVRREAGLPA